MNGLKVVCLFILKIGHRFYVKRKISELVVFCTFKRVETTFFDGFFKPIKLYVNAKRV